MSISKQATQKHRLPSEQGHLATLKELFSEGKFAEFWRYLGFSDHKLTQLESDLNALESEAPQRHKWTHSKTNAPQTESTSLPEPSVSVEERGADISR